MRPSTHSSEAKGKTKFETCQNNRFTGAPFVPLTILSSSHEPGYREFDAAFNDLQSLSRMGACGKMEWYGSVLL